MTGAEWLRRVFDAALRSNDPAVHPELVGALRALRDCGVLDDNEVREAQARLDARFEWLADPEIELPARAALGTHDALQAVLAPARPVADVDGLTVVLVAVELWTTGLVLHLAGLRSAVTDELDVEYQTAMAHWVTLADAAQAMGDRVPAPHAPGERLTRLPLAVADDVGTRYEADARQGGGSGSEWRAQWHLTPGVPAAATRLRVSVDGAGDEGSVLDLALPERR